jgi:hypothetical protein
VSPSKFLPSVYVIKGLRAAQGLVFLDTRSALQWLTRTLPEGIPEHVGVDVAEIIYYGGHLDSKSTEDIQRERHASD